MSHKSYQLATRPLKISSLGRFYIALGDAHKALNHSDEAQQSYDEAAKHLTEDDVSADLAAIVQLKISDLYVLKGMFNEAQ